MTNSRYFHIMFINVIAIVLLLISCANVNNESLFRSISNNSWGSSFGGKYPSAWSSADTINSISCDHGGNILVAGNFMGSIDVDPGESIITCGVDSARLIFLSKFDSNGNLLWVDSWGGEADIANFAKKILIDDNNNVYIIGRVAGTFDLVVGSDVTHHVSADSGDGFLAKINTDGNILWFHTWRSAQFNGLAIDSTNRVIVTGSFVGFMEFGLEPGMHFASNGNADSFVAMYNTDGTAIWARSWGGTGDDIYNMAGVDNEDNIYICGSYQNTVDFNPGNGVFESTAIGQMDCFLSKFDSQGNFIWNKTWALTNCNGIVLSATTPDIYIFGMFSGIVDFAPGPNEFMLGSANQSNYYLANISFNGEFQWAESWDSSKMTLVSMFIDKQPHLFLCGSISDSMDLDPRQTGNTNQVYGESDAFVLELDSEGEYINDLIYGGDGKDQCNDIYLDNTGHIFMGGVFTEELPLDFIGVSDSLVSNGGGDVFIFQTMW